MNKILYCSLFLFALVSVTFAQTHTIEEPSIRACTGFFADSGGTLNYKPNEKFTATICSDDNNRSHISLLFRKINIASGDTLCFYDGTSTAAPLIGCSDTYPANETFVVSASAKNTSGCLTFRWSADGISQSAGWLAEIFCAQPCQRIVAGIQNSTPAFVNGVMDICLGEEINMTAKADFPENNLIYAQSEATSSFLWDMGDGTTYKTKSIKHQYAKAGGYSIQLIVTDDKNCTSSNYINRKVRVSGEPRFFLANDIPTELCVGDSLKLYSGIGSAFGKDILVSPSEQTFIAGGVRSDSVGIPDGTGLLYQTSIRLSNFSAGQVLENPDDLLGICVNMEHSFVGDLEIKLTCPSGNTIVLHQFSNFEGGAIFAGDPIEGDDKAGQTPVPGTGYEYCWSSTAVNDTWLEFAANNPRSEVLPPGNYKPFESIAGLLGCPFNGEWTISIQDYWGEDNGVIFSWGLNVDASKFPALEKFTPKITSSQWLNNPSIFQNTPDSICAALQSAGQVQYTFQVKDEFNCQFDTSVNIQVYPLHHPKCHTCDGTLIPMSDTLFCTSGDTLQLNSIYSGTMSKPIEYAALPRASISNAETPTNAPLQSAISVQNIFPNTVNVNSIQSICLDFTHSSNDDLDVFLQTPSGKLLELTTDNGSNTSNMKICFTPNASQSILNANASNPPTSGNWQPEGNWSSLIGEPTNGNWTLLVSDDNAANDGILNSWSITFLLENNITYQWSPASGLSCTDCPNPKAFPSINTTYKVSATDVFGCKYTDDVFVVPDPCLPCKVDATIFAKTDATCFGVADGSIEIALTGAVSPVEFTLDKNIKQKDNPIFQQLDAGFHSVYIKDFNNCDTTLIFEILAKQKINTSISATATTCFESNDGTASVTASQGSGNYTYLWSDSQNQATALNLSASKYFVTVTDGVGCKALDSIEITQPNSILANAIVEQIACFEENDGSIRINPSGGTSPFSYIWSNGNNDRIGQNLAAGIYDITISDAKNCKIVESIRLVQPSKLKIDIDSLDITCFGNQNGRAVAQVTGGVAPYDFSWNDPMKQDTSIAIDLAAGNYTLRVVDANKCVTTKSVSINEPDSLVLELEITPITCFDGTDGSLEAIVTGGVAPYEFSFDFGAFTTQPIFSNLSANFYQLIVRDANKCKRTERIFIEEPPEIDVTINDGSSIIEIEYGSILELNSVVKDANGNVTYEWLSSQSDSLLTCKTCSNTTTRPIFRNTLFTLIVIDENGCFGKSTVQVNIVHNRKVFVPNSFTPNGDQINDDLYAMGSSRATVKSFSIFDRWGELVYQSQNHPLNDSSNAWNGTFQGKMLNSGTFLWHLVVIFADGKEVTYKGTTSIIK